MRLQFPSQFHRTATIQDLRLEGVGPWPIRRDRPDLELTANGPAEASGCPIRMGSASPRPTRETDGRLAWTSESGEGPTPGQSAYAEPPCKSATGPDGDRHR